LSIYEKTRWEKQKNMEENCFVGRDFEAITGFFSLFKVFLFLSTMMNQHETTI